ncbi:hypothetical protein ACWKWC_12140 [Geodermatophilus nigrescens]
MSEPPADREHPHCGQPQREFGGPGRHGLGLSRGHSRGLADDVFATRADRGGAAAWARQEGWKSIDEAALELQTAEALVRSAPARHIDKDHQPRNVMAGRIDDSAALAFEVAVSASTGWIAEWAVTAVALPDGAPKMRWTPARLWLHNPDKWVELATGDEVFDARWRVLSATDDAAARRLAADPTIVQALLATDDGDDIWTAAGWLAALRPDGHRPELLKHHVQLLATLHRSFPQDSSAPQ